MAQISLVGGVLAGGESRRMGRDKAALVAPGSDAPLLARAITVLHSSLPEAPLLVIGRAAPPEGWPADVSLPRFVPDDAPGLGPLGGLATALRAAKNRPVLLVACDMPLLTVEAIGWLRDTAAQAFTDAPDLHGVVAQTDGQPEPLFAVYAPECLPLVEGRIAAGRRLSLKGLFEEGRFFMAEVPERLRPALYNVNTPEDLSRLEAAEPGSPAGTNP